MSGELATNTAGTGGGTSGSTTGAGAVSEIATGGQRSSTIHITLGSLVDKLIFEGGYEGSRDDMQRELENRLIQLLQIRFVSGRHRRSADSVPFPRIFSCRIPIRSGM